MATRNPLVLVNGAIAELPSGDSVSGTAAPSVPLVAKFTIVGPLATSASASGSTARWYPDKSVTLQNVYFSLGIPNASGSVSIDVRKNGSTIFSGSPPVCTAGSFKSNVVTTTVTMTPSDYLTVVGITLGGSDATICIVYQ